MEIINFTINQQSSILLYYSYCWLSYRYLYRCVYFNCNTLYILYITVTFQIHNTIWWLFLLKMFDYIETCVFVLRKKQNQVTLLHIYHHVSNLIFCWYYLKYVLDERGTFVSLINCSIHVIMYIYYFIAAWSPELQQMISPIKPFITKLQMASINITFYN